MEDWIEFYRERRLGHMLRLVNNSSLNSLGDRTLPNLEKFFKGVQVALTPQIALPHNLRTSRGFLPSLPHLFHRGGAELHWGFPLHRKC